MAAVADLEPLGSDDLGRDSGFNVVEEVMTSYERICAEFRSRREAAISPTMQLALDRALGLTDKSNKLLQHLEDQRRRLLDRVPDKPPRESDVSRQAIALINTLEEREQLLQAELDLSARSRKANAAATPTRLAEAEISPDARALIDRVRERLLAGEKLLIDLDQTLRAEIEEVRRHKRTVFEAAASAMQASREASSLLTIVRVLGSFWLSFVLVERIYDTGGTSFEESLKSERMGESIRWGIGEILGLLPFVGVAVGLLELARSVKQARSSRWNSADETLAFLDSYEKALTEWITQADQFLEKTEEALAN